MCEPYLQKKKKKKTVNFYDHIEQHLMVYYCEYLVKLNHYNRFYFFC